MEEDLYLCDDAYEFYEEFKKLESDGHITEVKIGSGNKKIKVYNGGLRLMYTGDDVQKLARRINRRISIEN